MSVDLPTFGLPMMFTKPDLCKRKYFFVSFAKKRIIISLIVNGMQLFGELGLTAYFCSPFEKTDLSRNPVAGSST
jgi:hypothetical protein